MNSPQALNSDRTLITIDQSIIDGYAEGLADSLKLLAEMRQLVETFKRQADDDCLFTIQQACAYLGKSEQALHYYRRFGLEPYKKGQKGVWYRKSAIDAWLAEGRISIHKR